MNVAMVKASDLCYNRTHLFPVSVFSTPATLAFKDVKTADALRPDPYPVHPSPKRTREAPVPLNIQAKEGWGAERPKETAMKNASFFSSNSYQVLEGLAEPSLELTLVHVGIEECKPFHIVSEPRSEYIIHFVLSGAGFYSTGGSTWPLRDGQMFLIYPHTELVYGSEANNPWTYCWIGFKGVRAESVLKRCGFSRSSLVRPLAAPQEALSCIQEILSRRSLAPSDMLAREASMIRLFSLLAREYEDFSGDRGLETDSPDALYARLGREYIKEIYMHHSVTVEDIASHIGITRARLNRAFQKELKTSVQQYLIECRLRHAASLLKDTLLPVKEITWQSGYSDQLVFSAAFKKKYGLSPTAYRAGESG